MTARILKLWLHREERDAWLVSRSGVGAGVFLPKREIEIEAGHAVPVWSSAPRSGSANRSGDPLPVGPVAVEVPEWLALDRGLIEADNDDQGDLF